MNPMDHDQRLAWRMLDDLGTGVLLFGDDLSLKYLNAAAEAILEISARQAIGVSVREALPGMAGSALERRLRAALAREGTFIERALTLSLGSRMVVVDLSMTPLLDADAPGGLLVELTAVDRSVHIAQEAQRLAQGAVARALVRDLAHEIKNPLGGLRGAAQLLERELRDRPEAEYTRVILTETDRLRTLVDRMLGPKNRPRRESLNIHRVLEHVRTLLGPEAGARIRLVRDYDPSLPDLCGDPDLLVQAVLNIARNAIEAIGEGTGTVTFRTRVQRQFTLHGRRHRTLIRVDIVDDGPGIAPELKDRLFYPLVTGRADGTGLGLSIAQSLIDGHGGLIECDSEPGHTVFTIYLPTENGHGPPGTDLGH